MKSKQMKEVMALVVELSTAWGDMAVAEQMMTTPVTVWRWKTGESMPGKAKVLRLRHLVEKLRQGRQSPIRNPLESDTYSHSKDNTESTNRRKLASYREE